MFVENRDEGLGNWLFGICGCEHAEQLLIRNKEISWEISSFLLKVLIKTLLDLINSDINFRDLLHHATTAVNSSCFITYFLVE